MKKLKLDKYEKELLKDIEAGNWVPVKNMKKELEKYRKMAKYTLEKISKDKNLNLRVSGTDLNSIKNKALENGIPYQTMISALLHQFATGKINIIM